MSFKAIYTDKNGNQEFIKIPWYSAFGGTPRTKPKEQTCVTCKGEGVVPCNRCGGKGKLMEKRPGDKITGAQHFSAHDKEEYSKADNKNIIQMKKENKAWKDILEAIGKQSKSQLQEHYKKNLQDKVEGQANSGGDADNIGAGFSNHPKEEYSKANNKTIIQMKGAGKDWKEILEAIGKQSKSQLQAHWKNDLQQRAEQGGGGGGGKSSSQASLLLLVRIPSEADHPSQASAHDDHYWEKIADDHFQQHGTRIDIKEAKRLYGDD